jgi:hypothetical protein
MNIVSPHIHIEIHISDPWDLGEALKWEPLEGGIIATSGLPIGGMALVKLNHSFSYKKTECEYFIATPRHTGVNIGTLFKGKPILCGLTRIPKELAESQNPFDLTLWRGGVTIIGELELLEQ